MTEYKAPHRAKPEVWAAVERWSKNDMETLNCFLELRSRVEALEAAAKPMESNAPESSDSLVELVADAIYSKWGMTANLPAGHPYKEETRAAILAAADWLDQQELHIAATRLRMEAQ